jgi:Protein of unknown function (DUF2537)
VTELGNGPRIGRYGRERLVQLRARDGRALLAGDDGGRNSADGLSSGPRHAAPREVDPHRLAIGAELAEALHEWARVAEAVRNAGQAADGAAGRLVSRRGQQLAGRLAAVMRAPVSYADPLTGEVVEVGVPAGEPVVDRGAVATWWARQSGSDPDAYRREPTPWSTGLTLAAITAILVLVIVVALSLALGGASRWLALAANLVIGIGLAPSVWLGRRALVWRWVAYGVVAGIITAWIALLFTAL